MRTQYRVLGVCINNNRLHVEIQMARPDEMQSKEWMDKFFAGHQGTIVMPFVIDVPLDGLDPIGDLSNTIDTFLLNVEDGLPLTSPRRTKYESFEERNGPFPG